MKNILAAGLLSLSSQQLFADNLGTPLETKRAQGNFLMQHGNPSMPNLMQAVKARGDELSLTEQQQSDMRQWRESNGPKIDAMLKRLNEMEQEIVQASLEDKPQQELTDLFEQTIELRKKIAFGKLACRENLRHKLGEKKYKQVLMFYREKLAAASES